MACLPGMPCYGQLTRIVYPKGCDPCLYVKTDAERVVYTGPNLSCTGIQNGDCLETALEKIDGRMCSDEFVSHILEVIANNPVLQAYLCNIISTCPAPSPSTSTTSTTFNPLNPTTTSSTTTSAPGSPTTTTTTTIPGSPTTTSTTTTIFPGQTTTTTTSTTFVPGQCQSWINDTGMAVMSPNYTDCFGNLALGIDVGPGDTMCIQAGSWQSAPIGLRYNGICL